MADFNILSPDAINDLVFTPFQQALGAEEHQRLQRQHSNYLYYHGYQHRGAADELVKAEDLARPPGLDYDPTRYATNYFKAFIKRKARWQMGGKHGINVQARIYDKPEDMARPDYHPSDEQQAEFKRASSYEALLYQLWRENRMRERLLQAARDRLIAGRVGVKILFNPVTGKLKWVWHPDTEIFPVYSEDDFEELLAVHFVKEKTIDGALYYQKQTFELDADGECYLSEGVYNANLELIRTITPRASMGIDFIPVVLFPIEDLAGEPAINTEIDDMRSQTDVLNAMNEDAIDSLKFEMFGITAVTNAPAGTAAKMQIAPGAVVEITGADEATPDIKKVEGGFRWNEAFKAQYDRVKAALHDITAIPQINPKDLNFGGMNSDALHIVFHDIIAETEEHWLAWQPRLQELHEKSVRYLQERAKTANRFAYARETLELIGTDYDHEIQFALPLPDNRAELIELLTLEMTAGLESQSGALARAGVENTASKKQEIENERRRAQVAQDPYGGEE